MKIPPIAIIFQINQSNVNSIILLRIIIRSIRCLNQTSVRKTLGFSSIYSIASIALLLERFKITLIYILIYSIIILIIIVIIINLKINYINQLVFNEKCPIIKLNLWINILSISGFPLTLGFFVKIIVIQMLIITKKIIIAIVFILTSVLVIIFYIRLVFSAILIIHRQKKWNLISQFNRNYIITINILIIPIFLTFNGII